MCGPLSETNDKMGIRSLGSGNVDGARSAVLLDKVGVMSIASGARDEGDLAHVRTV